jgi:hypothetical protein
MRQKKPSQGGGQASIRRRGKASPDFERIMRVKLNFDRSKNYFQD